MPPSHADVVCPRCAARARFDEPFAFFSKAPDVPEEGKPVHRWGGWYVMERFPSLFPWKPPRGPSSHGRFVGWWSVGGYLLYEHGVVRCPACHLVAKHRLRWPADAFFKWRIRGQTLWARDEAHARVLLAYIGSTLRDPDAFPGYARELRKLPAPFIAGRNRALVAGRIRASLDG